MPGLEEYHGCTINWDVSRIFETDYWKATASVVFPPGDSGISSVEPVTGIPDRFASEIQARESVLKAPEQLRAIQAQISDVFATSKGLQFKVIRGGRQRSK